jgi:type I restriction enzyme S subunit
MENNNTSGWEVRALSDVFDVRDGTHDSPQFVKNGQYPLVTSKNLMPNGLIDLINVNYISEKDFIEINKRSKVDSGDLLFAMIGTIGSPTIVESKPNFAIKNVALFKRKSSQVDVTFLRYFLQSPSVINQMLKECRGATQKFVSLNYLRTFPIPIPTLSEQLRIVAKLDSLFERTDKAIALVEQNITNAKHLMASVLNDAFTVSMSDYKLVPIMQYVEFIGGSQPPKQFFSNEKNDGYIRLIQIRDYKSDDYLVHIKSNSTKKFCDETDVMIGRYGPPVFQILRGLNGAYNVALMKAKPDERYISKDFLFWFLQNPNIQEYIIGISQRSAGQSGVNKSALEKYNIPVPPLTVQKKISENLAKIFHRNSLIVEQQAQRKTNLIKLKSSLLDASFKGEL